MVGPTRVLVVDDSAFHRRTISNILNSLPSIEVIDTAVDGEDAVKKVVKLKPDIITLDLEMPRMDGFTFLRWLMKTIPTPVLVVSSLGNTKSVFKALDFGAVDFVVKPVSKPSKELENIKESLAEKISAIAGLRMEKIKSRMDLISKEAKGAAYLVQGNVDVVAIGASTGGPPALQTILSRLPENLPSGIIVSQHMPSGFTKLFADRLNNKSSIKVKEAEDGDVVQPGSALITPGGKHLVLKRRGSTIISRIIGKTEGVRYVPSVDIMMESTAEICGEKSLGVILTGMGNDGKQGMIAIKGKNGRTVAEAEETCIVYGMPGEAVKAGVVDKILPLDRIAGEIVKICVGKG